MSKRLSIIVPAYNLESYLPKCLGSLVLGDAALMQRLEVVVVNDGSTDRTSELGHEYERKYPGVFHVIDKSNGNYGSCINAALPLLKGEFVRVLDADDALDTGALIQLLAMLERCERDVDLVVSEFCHVDLRGRVVKMSAYDLPCDQSFTLSRCLERHERLQLHAITYRRELFTCFDYRQTEGISYTDTEWIIKPMAYVRKVCYLPCVLGRYTVGRAGQTMAPEIYNQNFHMLSRIALALASWWEQVSQSAVDTSRGYVNWTIYDLLRQVYEAHLCAWSRTAGYPNDDLGYFDRQLKLLAPAFYGALAELVVPSNHFPYYPVRSYRRWHVRRNPEYWLHTAYHWVAHFLRDLTRG